MDFIFLQQVQAEIDDVIGQGRFPRSEDRGEMHYTEAMISEVQRICDVVPLAVPHATTEDVEFRGYFIPKDTMVLPHLHSVHWDPELWPDPGRFDPSRFLDDDGKYRKSDFFIPFSIGNICCIPDSTTTLGQRRQRWHGRHRHNYVGTASFRQRCPDVRKLRWANVLLPTICQRCRPCWKK